jgi:hypothetical protein
VIDETGLTGVYDMTARLENRVASVTAQLRDRFGRDCPQNAASWTS